MQQPVARTEIVTETLYGVTIADPYRWMEDWHSEELNSWLEGQAAYTRNYLDALPERPALLKRIRELSNVGASYADFQLAAGHYFYQKREQGENMYKLVMRNGSGEPERVLFDPNALGGEVQTGIDWYKPSWDGMFVALCLSQGGSEESVLHVLDVESGKLLDLAIPHTYVYSSYVGTFNWLEDNRSFVYLRFPALPEGAPEAEKLNGGKMYLHHLGSAPEEDSVVFAQGISQGVPAWDKTYQDYPLILISPTSSWMLGIIQHGDLNEKTLYVAPRVGLERPEQCQWRKIADIADGIESFALNGDTLYLRTHKDAPRYKIIALSLQQPDLTKATTIVPASERVIEAMTVVGDSLLILDLDGGIGRMRRCKLDGSDLETVPLPFEGTIREWATAPHSAEVLLKMTGWTIAPRLYRYDAQTNTITDTGIIAPLPIEADFRDVEVHEVQAPAHDGTLIPLSIIHKKGLQLDGNNPTILVGYGSYGIVLSANFNPRTLVWLEHGGVYAVAHLRGGGEYGKEWHLGGWKLTKQNTIDDFIACAEYLIAQGYTRPQRLAGMGGSAGGIPTGGALVKRPDLWAAMIMQVPITNAMRAEFTANGPSNISEFGTLSDPDDFKGLYTMDSYVHVQDGVAYPAVMLTTGLNDPRVVVWQPAKMAARLQAATSSGKPVLLRVEKNAGHGMGSTQQQRDEEWADIVAFLLSQMGVTP